MSRIRTLLEWTVILVPLFIAGVLVFWFTSGAGTHQSSGLPDGTGGFFQGPLSPPQQFTKNVGDWQFSLPSSYTYTLAGKIVGRHE
jgi:energy-coupling factor transporter transmembrane protein EcfT